LDWLNRMKNALDLMEKKLDERLDIEEIAKAAYASPFHFQRMFLMLTGMTVAEYIRKRKLTLAAQELATSSSKVLDVAFKYGYDSPESFSKAFRKIHGITPSEARNPGVSLKAFPRITFHLSLKGDKEMDYRIVEKEAFTVIGKSIRVTCQDGEHTRQIPKFWEKCHRNGTIAKLASIGTGENAWDLLGYAAGKGRFYLYDWNSSRSNITGERVLREHDPCFHLGYIYLCRPSPRSHTEHVWPNISRVVSRHRI
jgi:AraC family transcriptional regulator